MYIFISFYKDNRAICINPTRLSINYKKETIIPDILTSISAFLLFKSRNIRKSAIKQITDSNYYPYIIY